MQDLIQGARKRAGLTQEQAAKKMFMTKRSYQAIEYEEKEMSPDEVLRLSKVLNCPALTMVYCRKKCAVGKRYCYDVLNNVDLSPIAILAKMRQEKQEAAEALEKMAEIMLNKRSAEDCSELELKELHRWSLEMLDVEHVIETLKLRLWDFMDVSELVRDHNLKCLEKHYVDKEKPELQLAG